MSDANGAGSSGEVESPLRDRVSALPGSPAIVSISDIHGYLDEGRSALLAVGDHPDFDPVVEEDDQGRLHWAGNDYVLVLNGDLIDRGPKSTDTMVMAERLRRQAPTGRVRITIGNHEMALMLPEVLNWPRWYSGQQAISDRVAFYEDVLDGHVVAAYQGHGYVYAHAGLPDPYDVTALNDRLVEATRKLHEVAGSDSYERVQKKLVEDYPDLFGLGGSSGREEGAGIFWLDFRHMPEDAPHQVVGHTRHLKPHKKGNVVNQNVIRNTRKSPGGEAAFVETPDRLVAVIRTADGGVDEMEFPMPDQEDDTADERDAMAERIREPEANPAVGDGDGDEDDDGARKTTGNGNGNGNGNGETDDHGGAAEGEDEDGGDRDGRGAEDAEGSGTAER